MARHGAWLTLAVVACLGSGKAEAEDLIVFATSSTAEAVSELADKFRSSTKQAVTVELGAPGLLFKRIEAGESPHIIFLDGKTWLDRLAAKKTLAPDTRRSMFSNRLVMAAHRDFPHTISIAPGVPLRDLLGAGKFAIADPAVDPAGDLARAALQSLQVLRQVEPKLQLMPDVRAALAAIDGGDDDIEAGIVYATDVRTVRDVSISGVFPRSMHPPIVYEIAVVAAKDGPPARSFHAYLLSREARDVFTARGFVLE